MRTGNYCLLPQSAHARAEAVFSPACNRECLGSL